MSKPVNQQLPGNFSRLRIIDELISTSEGLLNREILTRKVNDLLPEDEKVDTVSIDKDIKKLRELIAESHPEVTLKNTQSKGYFYAPKGFRVFQEAIDLNDKPALIIARELLQTLQGSILQPRFEEFVQRIMTLTIGEVDDQTLEEPAGSYIRISDQTPDPGVQWIEPLLKAIIDKETRLISYRSRRQDVKERHISPYLLKQYQNRWYMVAYDHDSSHQQKELVFALSNIHSCTFSNKLYKMPRINIREFFRYSIGIWHEHQVAPQRVVLKFYKQQDYVKSNPVHHSQELLDTDSAGNMVIAITVYPGPELDRLILGFGDMVQVLEPSSVQERIREKIQGMALRYS
jgi:predicted DNA-binding transcriptional regulator YafY